MEFISRELSRLSPGIEQDKGEMPIPKDDIVKGIIKEWVIPATSLGRFTRWNLPV